MKTWICARCDRPTVVHPDGGGCCCITHPDAVRASRQLVEKRHREAVARATHSESRRVA